MENNNTPLPDKSNKDKKEKRKNWTIEELAKKHKTSPAILAGVMEQQKWFPGKSIEDSEFQKAVKTFETTPQGNIPKGGNK